jgi:hypothetical protein
MNLSSKSRGESQRRLDVGLLRALVAATQQHDDFDSALRKVNPIAGPVVYLHRHHAASQDAVLAGIAPRQAVDAHLYAARRLPVAQALEPGCEPLCLVDYHCKL